MNYREIFEETLALARERKPTLLLHSCCAVCSSYVISLVADAFDTTVLYYNPNIFPEAEYIKRKNEQIRIIDEIYHGGVKYLDFDYDHGEFLAAASGLETAPEGGARCEKCFHLRLKKTADTADALGFDYFCTTLTVSPHKNAEVINAIGNGLSDAGNAKWLFSDFKKKDGYLRSTELARKYSIYRQSFCGCEFAYRGEEK